MKKSLFKWIVQQLWRGAKKKAAQEKPYCIAITGTVGKTSAKEAIAAVIEELGHPVVKTAGNMGTDIGVPLSLLGFNEPPDGALEWLSALWLSMFPPLLPKKSKRPYYILEYSADKPGDITFLAQQLPLQVGVLTSILPAHLAFYPRFEDLINEKYSLFKGVDSNGYAVINADDPVQQKQALPLNQVIYYGLQESKKNLPGVWAHHIELTEKGLGCSLDFVASKKMDPLGGQQSFRMQIQTHMVGRHQLYSLLAAAAIGLKEKVPYAKIKKVLETCEIPPGRGRIIEGQKDTLIIDDSYNASPEAVKAGLETANELAKENRRVVAILGTMNELGEHAEAAHREVAAVAAKKVDFLVVVGQYGQQMIEEATQGGLAATHCLHFLKPEQLLTQLEQVVERGDLIYVKASQNGMRLERVVKKLMAHPKDADNLLARQSSFWQHHS